MPESQSWKGYFTLNVGCENLGKRAPRTAFSMHVFAGPEMPVTDTLLTRPVEPFTVIAEQAFSLGFSAAKKVV